MTEGKDQKAPAAAEARKKKPAAKNEGFCVYLGPTIAGVIQTGTIYPGARKEIIKSLASAVEQYPLIPTLIVAGDTLAEDRLKVRQPGNLLHVNYHKLAARRK